jgi:hypothetical protein
MFKFRIANCQFEIRQSEIPKLCVASVADIRYAESA